MFDPSPLTPLPDLAERVSFEKGSKTVAAAAATAKDAPPPPLLRLGSLLDALGEDADARHLARETGRPFGPLTGLPKLDAQLSGALAPGLHILHGSPGVGKTAFALQVGASCGCPCLYVTCEMSPLELLRRHTARVTGTYLGRLKSGELSGEEVRALARRAAAEAPLLALLDATETPAPPASLLLAAEAVRGLTPSGEEPAAAHLLIVVDSLHSWADGLGAASDAVPEYDRLNEALSSLRVLSKRLVCPVLAIAERNRGSMKAGGQSAGAGTRKIEYGAETVLELQAKEEGGGAAVPDASPTTGNGEIEVDLRISKNRNGAAGRPIPLRFMGALQRYEESAI